MMMMMMMMILWFSETTHHYNRDRRSRSAKCPVLRRVFFFLHTVTYHPVNSEKRLQTTPCSPLAS